MSHAPRKPTRLAASFGALARRAFTLVEMLVALAVLSIALAIVAQVFGITTRTASTSAALGEVEAAVHSFTSQLEADLAGIDRTRSVLVLVGRTQAAARTPDDLAAGLYYRELTGNPANPAIQDIDPRLEPAAPVEYSDPRADLMMFLTHAPLTSRAPAAGLLPALNNRAQQLQRALQRGATFTPAHVVYGHGSAASVSAAAGGGWIWTDPVHIADTQTSAVGGQISRIAASRWTLARRATLLIKGLNGAVDEGKYTFFGPSGNPNDPGAGQAGEFPRILRGYSGAFGEELRWAADAVGFDPEAFLAQFNPSPLVLGNAVWPVERRPYEFRRANGGTTWSGLSGGVDPLGAVFGTLYPSRNDDPDRHVATVIDRPPAGLQSNLGLQALPGCAWFQVEFLAPEDPRNGRDHPLSTGRTDMERWCSVDPGATYVFVPDTEENRAIIASDVDVNGVPVAGSRLRDFKPRTTNNPDAPVTDRVIRTWPYAIRVTVRVFDRDGQLQQPLVRTIVHRFD